MGMTFLFHLSQEHPDIPRAEVEAVLRAADIDFSVEDEYDGLLFVDADDVDGVDRLAMTFTVDALIHEFTPANYQKLATKDITAEAPFAVRTVSLDETDYPDELEQNVGRIIDKQSEASVNLEQPEELFHIFIMDDTAYLTRQVTGIDRSQFEERQNQFRPFSKPVAVHPRLARALVNLSEVPHDGTILDPFCGTGGILIEAGLLGCDIHGMDIQQEMVDGTQENLETYGLEGDIRQGAIDDVTTVFNETMFDAVVTDLPYGRASKTEGDPTEAFLDRVGDLTDGKAVFMTNKESVDGHEPDFELFVHRSMDRYIYIIEP